MAIMHKFARDIKPLLHQQSRAVWAKNGCSIHRLMGRPIPPSPASGARARDSHVGRGSGLLLCNLTAPPARDCGHRGRRQLHQHPVRPELRAGAGGRAAVPVLRHGRRWHGRGVEELVQDRGRGDAAAHPGVLTFFIFFFGLGGKTSGVGATAAPPATATQNINNCNNNSNSDERRATIPASPNNNHKSFLAVITNYWLDLQRQLIAPVTTNRVLSTSP